MKNRHKKERTQPPTNGSRARLFYGYSYEMLRSRTLFFRLLIFCIACAVFKPAEPHKARDFSPLLRNKGASFPHALRCLSVRDTLPARGAVFDAVRL